MENNGSSHSALKYAYGPSAKRFMREVTEATGRRRSRDKYHWCAMTFKKHWMGAISAALWNHQARALETAAVAEESQTIKHPWQPQKIILCKVHDFFCMR